MNDKELLERVNKLEMEIMRLQAQNNMMKLLVIGSLETFGKRLDKYDSHQLKGSVWVTDGQRNMRCYSGEIPEGWTRGRVMQHTIKDE